MQTFFDNCLHSNNLRYKLIPSIHFNHQRFLQSDKARGTPGHTKNQKWSLQMLPTLDEYLHKKGKGID